jgi:putative ABC transport system permease protein
MAGLPNDLKYAIRSLGRSPVFTGAVLLTLALGIGANTAIFSVADTVLLKPLAYRDPGRLVQIWETRPDAQAQFGISNVPTSIPNFGDWRAQASSFEDMGAFRYTQLTLSGTERPEQLWGARLSPGMLPMLGIEPAVGRTFTEEDQAGRDNVVLIGNELWKRQFGRDPGMVGRTISLDGKPVTVVGIMPPGFRFPPPGAYPILGKVRTELWVPLTRDTANRGSRSVGVIGRLKPGVTIGQASAEMDRIASQLAETYPGADKGWSTALVPLQSQLTGPVRRPVSLLLASVGFVLLIACANVANLMQARATARRREIAVRAALGAGRFRIARQLLTESLLLGLTGGVLGLLFAAWSVDLLKGLLPVDFPRLSEIGIDWRVLGFTAALSLVTGIGFGLAPALSAARMGLRNSLGEGARGNTPGPAARRSRVALVTLQVSLALMLLVGAGLLIRSFGRLLDVDPGLRPDKVVTTGIALPSSGYQASELQAAFFNRLLARVRSAPGVAQASVVNVLPFAEQEEFDGFYIEHRSYQPNQQPSARWLVADPDYFSTMGITVLRGRGFLPTDDVRAPGVAMINQQMADVFWPGADPVGQRMTLGDPTKGPWRTVVGVVDNVRHSGLAENPKPEMYTPFLQTPWSTMNIVIRSPRLDQGTVTGVVRDALRALDPTLGLGPVSTMPSLVKASVAPERLNMLLLALLAGLALFLAALGVYGVVNYSVATRTGEMGLRMALGARPDDVVRLVLGEGIKLAIVGTVIGLFGAWATSRLLAGLLFGVGATDPITFVAVPLTLVGVTLLASWLPARRAARVDPMVALRSE